VDGVLVLSFETYSACREMFLVVGRRRCQTQF
jgi:hypothetical protein